MNYLLLLIVFSDGPNLDLMRVPLDDRALCWSTAKSLTNAALTAFEAGIPVEILGATCIGNPTAPPAGHVQPEWPVTPPPRPQSLG